MKGNERQDAGRLPSEEQLMLLQAALLPGEKGRAARTQWLAQANIDRLGKASRRLLPLLYARLREEGLEHPILPTLKGVKRHTWYNNQMLFSRAAGAIRSLSQAGIEVMVIKGAALTIGYYRDSSLRPMEDVDIMVRHTDARAAIDTLRANGWAPMDQLAGRNGFSEANRAYQHAAHFVHASGQDLDLHWNLLPLCLGADADADFWAASTIEEFEGFSVRILDPADQLLHICVHGTVWDTLTPIRWIPDAAAVLRNRPDLDWERLFAQARQRKLTKMVQEALTFLQRHLSQPIPPEALSQFSRSRVTLFERLEHHWLKQPFRNPFSVLMKMLLAYWRISSQDSLQKRRGSFSDFLCFRLRVEKKRNLPAVFFRKGWLRTRQWLVPSTVNRK